MKALKSRTIINPKPKNSKPGRRAYERREKLNATVHWDGVWINGTYVELVKAQQKRLVNALLDAGVPVRGLWRDLDYSSIDKRITQGDRV